MLDDRIYSPAEPTLLWHYCSANAFHAIITSGKIRLTDINMLNDGEEHTWGYSMFEEAATRLINRTGLIAEAPHVSVQFLDLVDEVLSRGQQIFHPFVACLSLNGDSLDQWRKYADGAQGFAIGFRSDRLARTPCSVLEVCYEREQQIKEIMIALLIMHEQYVPGSERLSSECFQEAGLLSAHLPALKHPSFQSEEEVRCVRAINYSPAGSGFKLVNPSDSREGGAGTPHQDVDFYVRDGQLVASVDMAFANIADSIAAVALGPRNPTQAGNVFLFMAKHGHTDIHVVRSSSPYR